MEWLINDAERDAVRRPGTRQRARAAIMWVGFADRVGLSVGETEDNLNSVREMTKSQAKQFRNGIALALDALGRLPNETNPIESMTSVPQPVITVEVTELTRQHNAVPTFSLEPKGISSTVNEDSDETPADGIPSATEVDDVQSHDDEPGESFTVSAVPVAEVSDLAQPLEQPYTRGLEVSTPGKDVPYASVSYGELDSISNASEAVEKVSSLVQELLAAIGYDGEDDTAIKRIEALLTLVGEEQKTAIDVDDEYIASLLEAYIATPSKAKMSSRIVQAACFWAHLRGVPMEDLVHLRAITKPDATSKDVHNANFSVKQALKKAASDGSTKLAPAVLSSAALPLVVVRESDDSESVETVTRPESQEQGANYDEEPKHVQLANDLLAALNLGDDVRRAIEELLNPDAKNHQLSDNKREVIQQIQKFALIRNAKGKDIFSEFEDCTVFEGKDPQVLARAIARVRQFVGVFWQNGGLIKRAPLTISQQSSNRNSSMDRMRFITDFNLGIEALIERINVRKATEIKRSEFTFGIE